MSYLLDLALDSERMQAVREHDRRIIACAGYRWPEVDKRRHPSWTTQCRGGCGQTPPCSNCADVRTGRDPHALET
jgi:hypothetical protein